MTSQHSAHSAQVNHDRPHAPSVLGSDDALCGLRREKALFDRVQELAQIGGWQWDRASDALYLTRETRRILRKIDAPQSMTALLACLCETDRKRLQHTLSEIRGDTGFDLELQGLEPDGTPFWVRMIGEPDPSESGWEQLSGTLQDITENKQEEASLRKKAKTDALTGLMNRAAILEHITARLQVPSESDLALLYIDLDRFKIVNDVLGHNAGDQLLMDAASRLREAVGNEGLIGRFGGDEFLVATHSGDDIERPARMAMQIQQRFNTPFQLGNEEFNVTTSIGISHAPTDGTTPKQLIQSADLAMYDCKHRQRNSFQAFSPRLAAQQQERLQVETQLRRALDNGEFQLVYQPQVDINTGKTHRVEALIRWHNPLLGQMRPDRFIDLAESTGEIVRIGHWVLAEACAQMRRWQDMQLPLQRIAINVSYRQLIGEDLAQSLQQMLEETKLPGHMLELEMTERVLVEDSADTLRIMEQLRMLGVQLSIDDFGEGYSALSYLRRLPIHALKLSHNFMKGVPENPSDVAICQAVLGIARSLGLGVVAEGIESEAQRDFLLAMGVTCGQGFLYAPGLAPAALETYLASQPH